MLRLVLLAPIAVTLIAQVANQPNLAYKRYRALAQDTGAPLAQVLEAADEWLRTYERNGPGPQTLPPYLDLARFYSVKGIRTPDILPLLEKGVAEIANPGSFTQARAHGNSPWDDDFQRSFAANVYVQIGRYDKARELLAAASQTFSRTDAAKLDSQAARIFDALHFQFRDSMVRLAIAEGRKQEALELERAILNERQPVISSRLLEAHRQNARQLWSELGRPAAEFDSWVKAGVP